VQCLQLLSFVIRRLCLFGAILALLSCEAEDPRVRKVLFVGIDGVRTDALQTARTPHLDGLRRRGAFAYDTQILGERYRLNDTISAPGWSSILTGVWADKHGVHDSRFEGRTLNSIPTFSPD
jgi:predicted AlkP superfamily phosphohydrolase/phosphomutase